MVTFDLNTLFLYTFLMSLFIQKFMSSEKHVNLLPPAYEVRGKVMFSVCVSIHWGGGGGVIPGLWSQVISEGYPQSLVPGSFLEVLPQSSL